MRKEIINRVDYLKNQKIDSIYFGGGTPSILNQSEIESLLKCLYENYSINNDAEITIECNPDDLSKKRLTKYKSIGFNRLSIGIQSFDDDDLILMNRSHNNTQSIQCISLAKKIGFRNITIDLIYGLPNQTIRKWEDTLNQLFSLNIQHFSAYSLTVEKKTALYNLVKTKKISLPSDDVNIILFNLLQEKAKANGFIHYEISSFSKEGFFSKHNSAYWKNKHYIGIGPSAHSFNGTSRRWNVSSNKKYISQINTDNIYSEEALNINQRYNEYVLTSLRTFWGVDGKIIKERFGEKINSHFLRESQKWKEKKHLSSEQNIYILTKTGKPFADAIASDLFIV